MKRLGLFYYVVLYYQQYTKDLRPRKTKLFPKTELAFCLAPIVVIIYEGECRSDFSGFDPEGRTMVCKMLGPSCSPQSTAIFKPDSLAALRRQESKRA